MLAAQAPNFFGATFLKWSCIILLSFGGWGVKEEKGRVIQEMFGGILSVARVARNWLLPFHEKDTSEKKLVHPR